MSKKSKFDEILADIKLLDQDDQESLLSEIIPELYQEYDKDLFFIIKDYLLSLREREDLDAIIPDLLNAMGFEIVKLAFRGEREYGIDIAAVKEEQNGEVWLYLIQVKPGDVTRKTWDSEENPNNIRPSLQEIADIDFQDLSDPRLRDAKKKVILAHNGILRENVRSNLMGFLEKYTYKDCFERWGIDRLSALFKKHLFNDIVKKGYSSLVKRAIVFVDTEYNSSEFHNLFTETVKEYSNRALSDKEINRFFGNIRIINAIIQNRCREINNLSPGIDAMEISVCLIWDFFLKNKDNLKNEKTFLRKFDIIIDDYQNYLQEWVDKIQPALLIEEGVFMGGQAEIVDYPMRVFKYIANLGMLIILQIYRENDDSKRKSIDKNLSLLRDLITHHTGSTRPMIESHMIDIFLGVFPLVYRDTKTAFMWLDSLFTNLIIRKNMGKCLPEAYNDIEAVIEYYATGEKPITYMDSSSALIYFLLEFSLIMKNATPSANVIERFKDVNLQVWYPPERVEEKLYLHEVTTGDTEVLHTASWDISNFILDVKARHDAHDKQTFSALDYERPFLLLIANKTYRTPVFPFWWRSIIPFEKYGITPNQP